jgi:hypothetical protein
MTSDATQAKWVRVLLAGVAPHIVSGAVLTGTHSPGAQGLLVLALLTLLAGAIVVRTVDPTIDAPHGMLVGLVAGLVGLRPGPLDLPTLAVFGLTAGAGWLGGWLLLARRRRAAP